ncbi:MAG: methyltransferase domain-containing protein, partial [Candidatus Eisenbacteria bacterium]
AAARARAPGLRVLDVRTAERFAAGHPAGAGQVPVHEWASRRMELPARQVPVLVVHDDPGTARHCATGLAERGYEQVAWLACELSQDPDGLASHAPAARLWSPSEFLERALPGPPRGVGRALDLACGSGRAAVHLALLGWQVEAWDLDSTALEMAEAFASRHGVRIATRICELEREPLAEPERRFDAIVVIRYLHRPLFPWLERALAPGGALVYETFRTGQEHFGHPRRARHLLEPGELLRAFPSLRVEIHEESPGHVPPVMARVLASKPV